MAYGFIFEDLINRMYKNGQEWTMTSRISEKSCLGDDILFIRMYINIFGCLADLRPLIIES